MNIINFRLSKISIIMNENKVSLEQERDIFNFFDYLINNKDIEKFESILNEIICIYSLKEDEEVQEVKFVIERPQLIRERPSDYGFFPDNFENTLKLWFNTMTKNNCKLIIDNIIEKKNFLIST